MNARHACAGNAAVCWRASTVQVALRPITRSRRRSAPRSLSDLALGPSASAAPTGTATFPSYSLQAVDIEQAKQGLATLEQYTNQAADAAGAAFAGLLSPFNIFGDSWFLNFTFFGVLGLLAYSLLVLAPRQ